MGRERSHKGWMRRESDEADEMEEGCDNRKDRRNLGGYI